MNEEEEAAGCGCTGISTYSLILSESSQHMDSLLLATKVRVLSIPNWFSMTTAGIHVADSLSQTKSTIFQLWCLRDTRQLFSAPAPPRARRNRLGGSTGIGRFSL